MRPVWIAVLIVVLLAGFMIYSVWAKDTVDVKAGSYGTVRGEIEVHYTDGTSKTITKIRTAEYKPSRVQHNDTKVSKFTFSAAYKPDRDIGDDVRVLCDKADPVHMTTLKVTARSKGAKSEISEFPLSLTVRDTHLRLETGDYSSIWADVEITARQLEAAHEIWVTGTNYLVFEAVFWVNLERDSSEVECFSVEFSVPFSVLQAFPAGSYDGDKSAGDKDTGNAGTDPTSPSGFSNWVLGKNVQFDQTVETKFRTFGSDTSPTAPWRGLG